MKVYLNWFAVNVASRALDSSGVSGSRGLLQGTKNLYEFRASQDTYLLKMFRDKLQDDPHNINIRYICTMFCDSIEGSPSGTPVETKPFHRCLQAINQSKKWDIRN